MAERLKCSPRNVRNLPSGEHLNVVVGNVEVEALEVQRLARNVDCDDLSVAFVGRLLAEGEACAVVESVKAASDVYAPLAGHISEHDAAIAEDPALINRDAAGEGWFFRMTLTEPGGFAGLMDAAAYAKHYFHAGSPQARGCCYSVASTGVETSRPSLISRSAMERDFSFSLVSTSGPTYSKSPSCSWA